MFFFGVILMYAGYAFVYSGIANLLNGGQGPHLSESLGFKTPLIPPGADRNILTPDTGAPPAASASGGSPPPFSTTGGGFSGPTGGAPFT